MKEAMLYDRMEGEIVRCRLCAHMCTIKPDRRGICGVRQNTGGALYSLVYDRVASLHVDPIEKKPLFHFYPGSTSLSLATMGCNFHCGNCQNYGISQVDHPRDIRGEAVSPQHIVDLALRDGCRSISYTYTEPTVYFELAYETAELAAGKGLANIFVSNGFMTSETLRTVAPYLDAINVDLKFFTDQGYRKVCGGRLQPVLDTIRLCRELDIWTEVTTLVIPGLNDSDDELSSIASFIASVDPSMPWHVSRFFPTFRMTDTPPTPGATLNRAMEIGRDRGLRYVYTGNMSERGGEDTSCHKCGTVLVRRRVFTVLGNAVRDGRCPGCGETVAGVGMG